MPEDADNKQGPKSRIAYWYDGLSRGTQIILKAAGGFVTLGTAIGMIFAVVRLLFPSEQLPLSLEGGANLSNLKVVPHVTLGQYLQYPGMPAKDQPKISEERRQRLGNIIYYDAKVKGFMGERVAVRWTVFDTDTNKPVSGLTEEPAWPHEGIRPQHDVSTAERETWVPFPPNDKGTFFVKLEAYAVIDGVDKLHPHDRGLLGNLRVRVALLLRRFSGDSQAPSEVRLDSEEVKVSTPDSKQ